LEGRGGEGRVEREIRENWNFFFHFKIDRNIVGEIIIPKPKWAHDWALGPIGPIDPARFARSSGSRISITKSYECPCSAEPGISTAERSRIVIVSDMLEEHTKCLYPVGHENGWRSPRGDIDKTC